MRQRSTGSLIFYDIMVGNFFLKEGTGIYVEIDTIKETRGHFR